MLLNIRYLFILFILFINIVSAQGFYPLNQDDLWQYEIYDEGGLSGRFSVVVLGDTILQNGNRYQYFSRSITSRYLRQEKNKVFAYSEYDTSEFVLFDFTASIQDTISRSMHQDSSDYIMLYSKYYDSQYGQSVWIFEEHSGSMTIQRWTVVDSLGVVRWEGELTPYYVLSGARINGVIRYGIISNISGDKFLDVNHFSLYQNYPNPFNNSTAINISIGLPSYVSLSMFNSLGQKVATLFQGYLKVGQYLYNWDASSMSSGIYFCRLDAYQYSNTMKLIFLK